MYIRISIMYIYLLISGKNHHELKKRISLDDFFESFQNHPGVPEFLSAFNIHQFLGHLHLVTSHPTKLFFFNLCLSLGFLLLLSFCTQLLLMIMTSLGQKRVSLLFSILQVIIVLDTFTALVMWKGCGHLPRKTVHSI